MQKSFDTIQEEVKEELVEKKSRFIAQVFAVKTEEEVAQKMALVKKIHRDAKHHVYAFRLENGLEKYSDDGEPSGTAGVPILDILRGEKLVNVLVVVTRYFGGILLGTGGLVRCYGGVAKLALAQTTKVKMHLCREYKIWVDYDDYAVLQHYCKTNEIVVLATNFLAKIEMNVLVIDSYTSHFLNDLSEITSRKALYEEVGQYYHS